MPTLRLGRQALKTLPNVEKPTIFYDDALKGFGLAVRASGSRTWIVEYRPGGGGRAVAKRRMTLGSADVLSPEQARERAREVLARVALGADPAKERAEKRRAVSLEAVYQRFMQETGATLKASTRALYEGYWTRHIEPRLGRRPAGEIRRSDIARLHRDIGGTRPTTANRVLALLSALFNWAIQSGELSEGHTSPVRGIKRYREAGRERFLTTDELARLGEAIREGETVGLPWHGDDSGSKHARKPENRRTVLSPYEAAALRLLILTGMRVSEILRLRWQEVDLERGMLFLPDSKTGRKPIVLGSAALEILKQLGKLPRISEYVIPGSIVGQPRGDYLKRPWMLVTKRAGLEGLRRHDLRHSFASIGAAGGLGLPVVGKLLGHASVQTTQRYSHLADDPLRRAADAIAGAVQIAMGDQPRAIEDPSVEHRGKAA